jgi:hypothetical protein
MRVLVNPPPARIAIGYPCTDFSAHGEFEPGQKQKTRGHTAKDAHDDADFADGLSGKFSGALR